MKGKLSHTCLTLNYPLAKRDKVGEVNQEFQERQGTEEVIEAHTGED